MIVLDASVCAPWFLADEASDLSGRAEKILEGDGAVVPSLWNLEIRNILVMAYRRGRIDRGELELLMPKLSRLPIEVDVNADIHVVVDVALRHRLSIYDATYLELAKRRFLPIATLDRKLAEAAKHEKVPLLE